MRRVQDVCFSARGTPRPSTVIRIGIGGLLCKSASALNDRNCRAFADMSIPRRLRLTNLAIRAPNLVAPATGSPERTRLDEGKTVGAVVREGGGPSRRSRTQSQRRNGALRPENANWRDPETGPSGPAKERCVVFAVL
jgi:hypothetical protein